MTDLNLRSSDWIALDGRLSYFMTAKGKTIICNSLHLFASIIKQKNNLVRTSSIRVLNKNQTV